MLAQRIKELEVTVASFTASKASSSHESREAYALRAERVARTAEREQGRRALQKAEDTISALRASVTELTQDGRLKAVVARLEGELKVERNKSVVLQAELQSSQDTTSADTDTAGYGHTHHDTLCSGPEQWKLKLDHLEISRDYGVLRDALEKAEKVEERQSRELEDVRKQLKKVLFTDDSQARVKLGLWLSQRQSPRTLGELSTRLTARAGSTTGGIVAEENKVLKELLEDASQRV